MQEICIKENICLYKGKNTLSISDHYIVDKKKPRQFINNIKNFVKWEDTAYKSTKDQNQHDILKAIQNAHDIISEFQLSEDKSEKLLKLTLFYNFSSKEEAFLYYALQCVQKNPSLNEREKKALAEEIKIKIKTFGKYYNTRTMLNALLEYANVPINIDNNFCKTCFKHKGPYGLIECKETEDNIKILNHELSHAELLGNKIPHFYSEARASYLSKVGYARVRAMMTLLGNLGDSEQILKHLINNEIDKIWQNIVNHNPNFQKELNEIRTILDNIKFSKDIINKLKENPQILKNILKMYEAKYGPIYKKDPIIMLLKEICEGDLSYESKDYLILENDLEVTLHYDAWDISMDTIIQRNSINPFFRIEKTWFSIIQAALRKELALNNSKELSPRSANYWVQKIMGYPLYYQFLKSNDPIQILTYINNQLTLKGYPNLMLEDFKILLDASIEKNVLLKINSTNFPKILANFEWDLGYTKIREKVRR